MSSLLDFILNSDDQFRRARLPSLYSDFSSQRSSNPDGFAANVAAWSNALWKAAAAGLLPADSGVQSNILSLNFGRPLLQSLETKEWGQPLALGTIIDEGTSRHQLVPFNDFITASKSIYEPSWKIQPWWLLSWGLKQLGITSPDGWGRQKPTTSLSSRQFVIVPNVEQTANTLISHLPVSSTLTDRIYPIQSFKEKVKQAINLQRELSQDDLEVLLVYLARDKQFLVFDRELVRLKAPGENIAAVSQQDKSIASLKNLISDLDRQIELLATKIQNASLKAQQAIKDKNRPLALTALKSKRLTETTLSQRTETLSQLEGVYNKIEQAADQVALVKVMEGSTNVLRNLRAEHGGVERVEDVIAELRDEMIKVDEVGNAIEAEGQASGVVDEQEVDEELEQMIQQATAEENDRKAKRTEERLAEIPTTISLQKESPIVGSGPEQPSSGLIEESGSESPNENVNALKQLSLNG